MLEVLNKKVTGPVSDNLNCYYGYCLEDDPKEEMNNVNKVSYRTIICYCAESVACCLNLSIVCIVDHVC